MLRAFGSGKLFGESYLEGPAMVVFLHGWGRSSQDFRATATELAAQGIASVALDLPGFGASPLPSVAGGAALYAELLLPILREISPAPVVLVGHSFGGRVASVIAAANPERVAGVVFTGVPLVRRVGGRKSPLAYRWLRALAQRGLVSDAQMERVRQRYGSADYRAARGLLREILVTVVNESYESQLARITAPVHMLWGANDTDVPTEVATRAAALLPTPPAITIVPECGHLVPTSAPLDLARCVAAMVTR